MDDAYTETVTYMTKDGTPEKQQWTYPSRQDCLLCHTQTAGFVLGATARQLDREFDYGVGIGRKDQLNHWLQLGMFERSVARLSPYPRTSVEPSGEMEYGR